VVRGARRCGVGLGAYCSVISLNGRIGLIVLWIIDADGFQECSQGAVTSKCPPGMACPYTVLHLYPHPQVGVTLALTFEA